MSDKPGVDYTEAIAIAYPVFRAAGWSYGNKEHVTKQEIEDTIRWNEAAARKEVARSGGEYASVSSGRLLVRYSLYGDGSGEAVEVFLKIQDTTILPDGSVLTDEEAFEEVAFE